METDLVWFSEIMTTMDGPIFTSQTIRFPTFYSTGNGVFEDVGFRASVSVGGVMQRPNDAPSEKTVAQINIVLNWFEELKERVPVR
jgi:hypothetical protein